MHGEWSLPRPYGRRCKHHRRRHTPGSLSAWNQTSSLSCGWRRAAAGWQWRGRSRGLATSLWRKGPRRGSRGTGGWPVETPRRYLGKIRHNDLLIFFLFDQPEADWPSSQWGGIGIALLRRLLSTPAVGETNGIFSPSTEDLSLLPCWLSSFVSGLYLATCPQPLYKMELTAGDMLGQFHTDQQGAFITFTLFVQCLLDLLGFWTGLFFWPPTDLNLQQIDHILDSNAGLFF